MTSVLTDNPPTPAAHLEEIEAVACAHCTLPVPPGLLSADRAEQFCCHGCETAYNAIRSCGLERYYEYLQQSGGTDRPASSKGRGYEEFDDPAFAELYCEGATGGTTRTTLLVEGMHCAACVWLLEKLPSAMAGVVEARVDLGRSQLRLAWRPEVVPLSRIARFIDRLGYAPHPLRESSQAEARRRENRAALARIAVAGALFMNTMLIALALYASGSSGGGMEPGLQVFFRWVSAGLAAISLAGPGRVFFRGAIASIRVRTLHMDVPVALALLVGLAHGLVNTILSRGEVYFDTLATLVFLLLIGRWIQQCQQRRALDAVELLFSLTPSSATLIEESGPRVVPVEALGVGDVVEVRAGDNVPTDGVVCRGASSLNVALLTGESAPVEVREGDAVAAGSVNLSAPIRVRVEATGRRTRVGQLMSLIEEHARTKPPIVQLADTIAARFVGVVIALAALTFALWSATSLGKGLEAAVSLLIITCPCALGLATPLAIMSAIGRAASSGILVKGGASLEVLARRGTLVLDKTGTLTTGDLRVVSYHGTDELRPLIGEAERMCVHPIARALVEWASAGAGGPQPTRVHQHLGGGIEASFDHAELLIGSETFVMHRCGALRLPDALQGAIDAAASAGLTPVLVARGGVPEAVVVLGDDLRPEAACALGELRAAGWDPVLLSGDDPRIALAVGARLGLASDRALGGVSPEDKARRVAQYAREAPTVMVGDGVNDAAALAAATVGVAVRGGAEAAMSAADVYFAGEGLRPLVRLFDGARQTARTIRLGLAVSLLYNVLFGGLAIAGLVTPLVAAVLMPISSATVVILSFRGPAFRGAVSRGPRNSAIKGDLA